MFNSSLSSFSFSFFILKKKSGQLRERFTALERNHKLGKVSDAQYTLEATEILSALKRLGESLSPREEAFLAEHKTAALASFEAVNVGGGADASILSSAASQVKSAASK